MNRLENQKCNFLFRFSELFKQSRVLFLKNLEILFYLSYYSTGTKILILLSCHHTLLPHFLWPKSHFLYVKIQKFSKGFCPWTPAAAPSAAPRATSVASYRQPACFARSHVWQQLEHFDHRDFRLKCKSRLPQTKVVSYLPGLFLLR